MNLSLGITETIYMLLFYIILANSIVIKYLYDVKEVEECNNTPMLTFVYDYYILELGIVVTLALINLLIIKQFNYPKIMTHRLFPFVSKLKDSVLIFSSVINCIFFYVLYEIYSKKICNDIHPYLTYYLMYNSSSNILMFVFIIFRLIGHRVANI